MGSKSAHPHGQGRVWDLSEDPDRLTSATPPTPGSAVGMTNAESRGKIKCSPLKTCTKFKQDNTVKTLTIYFWKTLPAGILLSNRIFLIQIIITRIFPSIASSQLGSYLPLWVSWKNWKDIRKRVVFVLFFLT